jgi:hypothetical protein
LDLDKLNKWLTLIANVAILGGLVFVALEIQQNTNAVRSAAVQEATNIAREHPLMYVQNPEINRLEMADYDLLSEEDKRRRFWLAVSFWHAMQGLYRQNELGTFPQPEWEVWVRIICANYAQSHPELWSRAATTHSADFVEFVENCEPGSAHILPD